METSRLRTPDWAAKSSPCNWMARLQYELDRAEWMVSETQECPVITEEMALAIMLRRDGQSLR